MITHKRWVLFLLVKRNMQDACVLESRVCSTTFSRWDPHLFYFLIDSTLSFRHSSYISSCVSSPIFSAKIAIVIASLLESPLARFKKVVLSYNYCAFAKVQIKNWNVCFSLALCVCVTWFYCYQKRRMETCCSVTRCDYLVIRLALVYFLFTQLLNL